MPWATRYSAARFSAWPRTHTRADASAPARVQRHRPTLGGRHAQTSAGGGATARAGATQTNTSRRKGPRETWVSRALDGRRLGDRLREAGVEDGLALVRPDRPRLDLLGPVARHLVAGRQPPQRRRLVAAARRLHVRAARMEAARGGRRGRARQVAGEQDRLALPLDDGVRDRHRRE